MTALRSESPDFAFQSMTRRSVLRNIGLLAATTACPFCRQAHAADEDIVLCATSGTIDLQALRHRGTTGTPNLDTALALELNNQSKFFGYRPAFRLFEGPHQNAMATPKIFAEAPQAEGTILYHLETLKDNIALTHWGGAVVAGVIAHEFSHIYQFRTGKFKTWKETRHQVKYAELHADYLSAFYMGKKYKNEKIDIADYTDRFFEMGDYDFSNATHHGTKEERYATVKAGFNLYLNTSNASVGYASDQAEKYIKEYIKEYIRRD